MGIVRNGKVVAGRVINGKVVAGSALGDDIRWLAAPGGGTKRMTITGTLGRYANSSLQLIASRVSLASFVPRNSRLNDPNNPSLLFVILDGRKISGGSRMSLYYATNTPDSAFPSRVTMTNGTFSIESNILNGISTTNTNLRSSRAGSYIGFTHPAIGAGLFNPGDNITIELYD